MSETLIETDDQNQNEYEKQSQPISPPPRKRLGRISSMRRTDADSDQPKGCDQNELCASQTVDNHMDNHENATAFDKSQVSEDNTAIQKSCLNNVELIATEDLASNQLLERETNLRPSRNESNRLSRDQLMERMRRWRERWITSEEAKIARKRRFTRFLYFCRVFLAHLFSTTGLCLLVIAYSVLGAFVFNALEYSNEDKQIKILDDERKRCATELWNYTITLNVFREDDWTEATIKKLENFERIVTENVKKGYDGTRHWNFFSALLYSVTVITTIGYGNVTCKTSWGKIVTMIYALFGIPIMFLCLANLGNIMAKTFRFSYRRICCTCFCFASRVRSNNINKQSNNIKNKDNFELKKANNSNLAEDKKEIRVVFEENDESKIGSPKSTIETASESTPNMQSSNSKLKAAQISDKSNESCELKMSANIDEDRVPAWLVILLVIGYIMGGAVLFKIWEKDWGLLNGAYFCFITLTTIGFGDLVPGSLVDKFNTDDDKIKFTFCCIYMIVGLSLLAMSFNLVQEEIVIKCKEIARKIGILPHNRYEASSDV